jgi:hypothetical protein
MDANELRALQAPLKKQYREQPETARTLARGEALLDLNHIACVVHSWGGETNAGLHPATGGDGSLACAADMLLEALVACAGVTMCAVATAMGVKLRGGRVIAEGHWDARGTLGVHREVPVGLTDIALTPARIVAWNYSSTLLSLWQHGNSRERRTDSRPTVANRKGIPFA